MNIPEYLIRKIESGEATYHTKVTGPGPAFNLSVPDNKFIVIFGYTYHHFIDMPEVVNNNGAFDNCVHLVQFQSKNRRWVYFHRTTFGMLGGEPTGFVYMPFIPDTQVSVYQKHEENVNITIWRMPHPRFWRLNVAKVPRDGADIEQQPLGVGVDPTGEDVILSVAPNVAVDPGFLVNDFVEYNPSDGGIDDFKSLIGLVNNLNLVESTAANKNVFRYPVITVHYCLFNKNSVKTDRP